MTSVLENWVNFWIAGENIFLSSTKVRGHGKEGVEAGRKDSELSGGSNDKLLKKRKRKVN